MMNEEYYIVYVETKAGWEPLVMANGEIVKYIGIVSANREANHQAGDLSRPSRVIMYKTIEKVVSEYWPDKVKS